MFYKFRKKAPLFMLASRILTDCRQMVCRGSSMTMRKAGSRFNGVLKGGFFKTPAGIKFMEFNGRFGDPEGLNILSILDTSFSDLLVHIWSGTLSDNGGLVCQKSKRR